MGRPRNDGEPSKGDVTTADNKKKLLKALEKNQGLIYRACRAAKIDNKTYYNYRNSDQAFADAVDEIIENMVDDVEHGLIELMDDEDHHVQVKARNIFLAAKGRKRGYGTQKQELTGEGGGPVVVYVNTPSNSRIPPRDPAG